MPSIDQWNKKGFIFTSFRNIIQCFILYTYYALKLHNKLIKSKKTNKMFSKSICSPFFVIKKLMFVFCILPEFYHQSQSRSNPIQTGVYHIHIKVTFSCDNCLMENRESRDV